MGFPPSRFDETMILTPALTTRALMTRALMVGLIVSITLVLGVVSCTQSDVQSDVQSDGVDTDFYPTDVDGSTRDRPAEVGVDIVDDSNDYDGDVPESSELFLPPLAPNVVIDPVKIALYGGVTEAQYFDAIETRIVPCMRERGWDYVDGAPMQATSIDRTPVQAGALAAYIRRYGYQIIYWMGTEGGLPKPRSDNSNYWRSLDQTMGADAQDRFLFDLDGENNCRDRATREVQQELQLDPNFFENYYQYVDTLIAQSQPATIDDTDEPIVDDTDIDSLLSAQFEGWDKCMIESGFPEVAETEFYKQIIYEEYDKQYEGTSGRELAQLRDYELRMAAADVHCSEIHTWPVIHYQQTRFLQELIEKGIISEMTDPLMVDIGG